MSLTLDTVTLTYPDGDGRLTALDEVGLVVPPGTVTAVVGPSGSGKSSLLAVAATLATPTAGASSSAVRTRRRCGPRNGPSCADARSGSCSSSRTCCPR